MITSKENLVMVDFACTKTKLSHNRLTIRKVVLGLIVFLAIIS